MKPKKIKPKALHFLLGLSTGLAASLCALEYGYPLMNTYLTYGVEPTPSAWDEQDVVLTFPKPPVKREFKHTPKPVVDKFEIVDDERKVLQEEDLPDIVVDDSIFFAPEVAVAPEVSPPLPPWRVESMPYFGNGPGDHNVYLGKNLHYPEPLKDINMPGRVAVEFIIDQDGNIDDRSIKIVGSSHELFSKEVVRVLKQMPAWHPATVGDKGVPVVLTLPVNFRLR